MKKKLFFCLPAMLFLLCGLTLRAEAAELPQLAAPTELTWHRSYEWNSNSYMELPGMVSYKVNYPCQNEFEIALYSTASENPVSSYSVDYGSTDTLVYNSEAIFIEGENSHSSDENPGNVDFPSGTYYFTVRALGDGDQYRDSEEAVSPSWTYTAPSQKLPTPTNLRWDGRHVYWDGSDDDPLLFGYIVDYFWEDPQTGNLDIVGGSYGIDYSEDYLDDYCIERNGPGKYYFRVRAISSNVNECTGSYWSELSPAYNLTEVASGINSSLESIFNNYSDAVSGGETLDAASAAEMKEWLWEEVYDRESLEAAMAADTGNSSTNAYVENLESLVGGPAEVRVADDAPEGLNGNISIIGANLNTDGTSTTTLNVGKADEGTVIPEQYQNTIQFSMELDGVTSAASHELKVPVKITMPVPTGINPDFLVLLHFHADGTYEEITLPHIFEDESGNPWVSFVVTSFSDFALAERDNFVSIQESDEHSISFIFSCNEVSSAIAVIYDSHGKLLLSEIIPMDPGLETMELELADLESGTVLKVFLLDSDGSPLCQADDYIVGTD